MFKCPKCDCQSLEEDLPNAYRIVMYNDNGDVINCETEQGYAVINSRCADCSYPFKPEEWTDDE